MSSEVIKRDVVQGKSAEDAMKLIKKEHKKLARKKEIRKDKEVVMENQPTL